MSEINIKVFSLITYLENEKLKSQSGATRQPSEQMTFTRQTLNGGQVVGQPHSHVFLVGKRCHPFTGEHCAVFSMLGEDWAHIEKGHFLTHSSGRTWSIPMSPVLRGGVKTRGTHEHKESITGQEPCPGPCMPHR